MKLADVLTWSRLFLIIPITILVWLDARTVVLVLFIISALTDFFDGKVARWTKTASKAGAKLDSRVDTISAPFFIIWIVKLFPAIIAYWMWAVIMIIVIVAEVLVAKWKLRTYTGLHLYSQKTAMLTGSILLPALLLFGVQHWLIILTIAVGILSQLEAIVYLLRGGKNLDAKSMFSPIR